MRFLVFTFLLTTVLSGPAAMAEEYASEEAQATKPLRMDEFESITKLLYAGKLAPHMKCDLKVRTYREERKFTTGKKLVELIEIVYYPGGIYADTQVKVLIPAEFATYGTRYYANRWSGTGEEVKIEAHDRDEHWLRFIHDGKGGLVFFSLGNRLATFPCMVK